MRVERWVTLLWLLPLVAIVGVVVSYWIPAPATKESEVRIVAERATFDVRGAMDVVGELEIAEASLEFNAGELRIGPARLLPRGKLGSLSVKPNPGSSCRVSIRGIRPRPPVVKLEYYAHAAESTWKIEARPSSRGMHLGLDVSRLKSATIDGMDEFDLELQGCDDKASDIQVPTQRARVSIPQRAGNIEWSFPDVRGSERSVRDMLILLANVAVKGKLEVRNGVLRNPAFVGVKPGSRVVDDKGGVKELGERSTFEESGRVGRIYELQITQAVELRFSLLTRDTLFDYVSNHPLYIFIGGLVLWVVNNLLMKRALDAYKKTYGGKVDD